MIPLHILMTAGCKTIDRFSKRYHDFFLFIPWHINKDFSVRNADGDQHLRQVSALLSL